MLRNPLLWSSLRMHENCFESQASKRETSIHSFTNVRFMTSENKCGIKFKDSLIVGWLDCSLMFANRRNNNKIMCTSEFDFQVYITIELCSHYYNYVAILNYFAITFSAMSFLWDVNSWQTEWSFKFIFMHRCLSLNSSTNVKKQNGKQKVDFI